MRITSIEFIDIECDVYDIEVEHDHSYVVEGVVLHNCTRCYTAESNGPYDLGAQPSLPIHPRCRCVNTPHIPGLKADRPFVRDDRSIKNIPKAERGGGKTGRTRDSIEDFFNRMTKADRREYMGKSRAALWEEGKIDSVSDLVNQRTLRELTLDQLPKL